MFAELILLAVLNQLPPAVIGDFDRDGTPDRAEMTAMPAGGQQIVIWPGAHGRSSAVIETFPAPGLSDPFLDTAIAGTFETWCGKGGGEDDDPCPMTAVVLQGGELVFGQRESTLFVVIWTGTTFESVLISD